jgi:hypothetical protein
MAREMLTPTLLAAMAVERSSQGTSCGTTACQAGEVNAPAAPSRPLQPIRKDLMILFPRHAERRMLTRLMRYTCGTCFAFPTKSGGPGADYRRFTRRGATS